MKTDHELRQRRRDVAEIVECAGRRGMRDEAEVRARVDQLEALLPGLVNLHKLKAADW